MKHALSRLTVSAIIASVLLSGCGIAGFESLSAPNAPAGLSVSSTNKWIIIKFGAYNNESTFAGYNVFISDQHPDNVVRQTLAVTNDLNLRQLPTQTEAPSPDYRNITIVVKFSSNDIGFTAPSTWYVGVSAYDFNSRLNSPTSEVHKVEIND